MVGRTPANIVAIRPLRDGVISEFEVTEAMLDYFIKKAHSAVAAHPAPSRGHWHSQRRDRSGKSALCTMRLSARGARERTWLRSQLRPAIGVGLPVIESRGSMIVDIGGGTTEVAVFSLGGIVVSRSIRVAGDEMDEDIMQYVRQKYNLLIGERMAERVKIEIGSGYPLPEEKVMTIPGSEPGNRVTGGSRRILHRDPRALANSVNVIVDTITTTLE